MTEQEARGAPHGVLLAAVVVLVVAAPMIISETSAITDAISGVVSPVGLLLIPILLLLTIHFLSSDTASFLSSFFSSGAGPDSIHRVSGSPVGVALLLLLVLFLVSHRVSLFGGADDDSAD